MGARLHIEGTFEYANPGAVEKAIQTAVDCIRRRIESDGAHMRTLREVVFRTQRTPIAQVTRPVQLLWTYTPPDSDTMDRRYECQPGDKADTRVSLFSEKTRFRVMAYLFHQDNETEPTDLPSFSPEKDTVVVPSTFPLRDCPCHRIALALSDHLGGDLEFD